MFTLPKVRRATIGIPLCVTGIALIFVLKPAAGSSVQGLAILTVLIQAQGALAIVLFFTGLQEYLKYRESLIKISRSVLDDKSLLDEAWKLGRRSFIDTEPNPEHQKEWVENARMILKGSLEDLLDAHPVSPPLFRKILEQSESGLNALLQISHQNHEKSAFSLSIEEILDLVPGIFVDLEKDPEISKRLSQEPALPQNHSEPE
ncbi:MAG: hypothetical protein ACYCTV_00075 [Leptospirales bacterium]